MAISTANQRDTGAGKNAGGDADRIMTDETTKFDVKTSIALLESFDKAILAETGMKHGRAAKIRELMREYVKTHGGA